MRKFNAKRTRLIKQVPELIEFLPEKASVKNIRNNITTRNDFNKQINSLERFMRKGSETPIVTAQGVKTTKYEVNELRIKTQAINQKRAYELKNSGISTSAGTMGSIRENSLKPKKFNLDAMNKGDWEHFKKSVEKQYNDRYQNERNQKYKENMIEGIRVVFGDEGNDIIRLINKISADLLTEAYYKNPLLHIDFLYAPEDIQYKKEILIHELSDLI